ncbi:MAG: Ribosomal protein S12 methylthiotransferase RimO [Chlamydiae bacterium]|nr:Ribosomal protein S12 methylthiotransferase RimO [Chlamydiota bacterium]
MKSGNKINFTSLGCPRNLVDSEVMLGLLMKSGYEITPVLEEADYLIVNTCGFLKASRDESNDVIQELLDYKKEGAKVIVTGCMAQTHQEEIRAAYPEINAILGSGDVASILKAIEQESPKDFVTSARSYLIDGEVPRTLTTPQHYAYLKIAEGCRKRCSFCIIPKIKGPLKSKSVEQVVNEFKLLLRQGVQEVILIAQDLGDFGKDHGFADGNLKALLKEITSLSGHFWLRLLYIYPDEIDEELVDIIARDKRILPYLDMPIQHINSRILKKMRRKTSKEDILDVVDLLKKKIPDVVIRTSLMVGFPSETDEEFEELCAFVQEHPLDNVGVFKFSKEKGAYAYSMDEQIPEEVKEKRYNHLMSLLKTNAKKQNQKWVGKTLEVFVEGYHPESELLMQGRFYGQSPDIDGIVILNQHDQVDAFGKKYHVKITDAFEYDLLGSVVKPVDALALSIS